MIQLSDSLRYGSGALACVTAALTILLAPPAATEERKPLHFGARADAPPMSYKGTDGEFRGFSIDICDEVKESLKSLYPQIEVAEGYVEVTASNRQPMLRDGDVDTVCGAFSVTEKRLNEFDFSFLTFVSGASVAAPRKRGSALPGPDSAAPKSTPKVVVVADTTTRTAVQHFLGSSVSVESRDSHYEALTALVTGDVSYYFGDRVILVAMIGTLKEADEFVVGGRFLTYEPYAMPFAKGKNTELRHAANVAIAELYRSRRIQTIYKNHFNQEDPNDFLQGLYRLYAIPK